MANIPGALIGRDVNGNLFQLYEDANGNLITSPVQNVSPSQQDNSITQTAYQLITSALRLIGVLAVGELPSADDTSTGLMVLSQMLDAWNSERLAIYATRSDDYALQAGKQAYTLGPGGDFNTNRPARIDGVSAILLNNPSNPIEVPIAMLSVSQWQNRIPVKTVQGTFPFLCYDDGGFPLRTLNLWPIPTTSLNTLRLYTWQGLGIPATLQTNVSFPPGYAEAFRYNLAVRLAPEFQAQLDPVVASMASESLARVRTMNAPDLTMQSDLLLAPSGYNWKADLFGIAF